MAARREILRFRCCSTAGRDDLPLLRALLFEAAFWRSNVPRPSLEQALAAPDLARYVEGFGRPGDFGIVAEAGAEPLGAVWWRYFRAGAPGYGFVDEATPEVCAAVLPGHRGRGTGTALLGALEHEACQRGIKRLSLSVERDNPAAALYERVGFRRLGRNDNALTMVMRARRHRPAPDPSAPARPVDRRVDLDRGGLFDHPNASDASEHPNRSPPRHNGRRAGGSAKPYTPTAFLRCWSCRRPAPHIATSSSFATH